MTEPTTASTTETTDAPPAMGEFERLLGVLFDPKPAFADIGARPRGGWVPLLILAVLIAGFTFAFGERVGWTRFTRQQIADSPFTRDLPADQREEIIRDQAAGAARFGPIQAALAFPLIALVTSAALLFVFNVLLGTELRFGQFWGITCYSLLTHVPGTLLAFGALFLKEPQDFDLQNPVASNPAVFLDPNTVPAWAVSLAGSLDVFSFWNIAVLAVGLSTAARKLAWSKALTWVTLTWAFYVLLKVALAFIF